MSPLDELDPAMRHVDEQKFAKPTIHLIDAEADSVAHYRVWSSRPGRLYLVRGDDRLVECGGVEQKCSAIQAELRAADQLRFTREVRYHGHPRGSLSRKFPFACFAPANAIAPKAALIASAFPARHCLCGW